MATQIELPTTSKKRKRSPSLNHGIATPPKSPSETPFVEERRTTPFCPLETTPSSPPFSVEPSPQRPNPDVSTTLLTHIQQVKDGKTLRQPQTTLFVSLEAFIRFERALAKDKPLARFFKTRIRYEWDSTTCLFTLRGPDVAMQDLCLRISQCLEKRFSELADSKSTLEGLHVGDSKHAFGVLDTWERYRVKELVELIRPLPLQSMKIGQERVSPDLCFTFGTTKSLAGLAQIHVDPLVVIEVRYLNSTKGREEMENRARLYLEEQRFKCPFRHNIKTVVLIHYTQEGSEAKEVYITVSRVKMEIGKRVITTQVVDPFDRTPSGHIDLLLSDFLPQDAIELGFKENENGIRACDGITIDVDITEAVQQATRHEKNVQEADDVFPSLLKRRRVNSFSKIEEVGT